MQKCFFGILDLSFEVSQKKKIYFILTLGSQSCFLDTVWMQNVTTSFLSPVGVRIVRFFAYLFIHHLIHPTQKFRLHKQLNSKEPDFFLSFLEVFTGLYVKQTLKQQILPSIDPTHFLLNPFVLKWFHKYSSHIVHTTQLEQKPLCSLELVKEEKLSCP